MKKTGNLQINPKFKIGKNVYIKEINKVGKIFYFRNIGYYFASCYFYQYSVFIDNDELIFMEDELSKLNYEIHITSNGVDTFAVLKDNGKVIKRAKSKCMPEDTYDFEIGSTLAFNRLFNNISEEKKEVKEKEIKDKEVKEKEWNAKVVCISSDVIFKKGRIYKIENGYLYASCNSRTYCQFENIDELNNYYNKKFIELLGVD